MAKQFKDLDEALGWLESYEPTTKGGSAQFTTNRFNDKYAELDSASKKLIDKLRTESSYDKRNTWDNQGNASTFRSTVTDNPYFTTYRPAKYALADFDADGKVDASTDALFFGKYMAGMRGDEVFEGIPIGEGAQRSKQEILDYLAEITSDPELSAAFDLDKDGNLTQDDGSLLHRHSFGLTGDALTNDITNTSPAEVQDKLAYVDVGAEVGLTDFNDLSETYSPLDIDQDGRVDALTDGLLYMRYVFGLTGDSLTSSAVSEDATRTAKEIEGYLEYIRDYAKEENPGLFNVFDIDGDGNLDALTDSLLLLRYAFGLTGDSLVSSAVAEDAPTSNFRNVDDVIEDRLRPFITDVKANQIRLSSSNNVFTPSNTGNYGGVYVESAGGDIPEAGNIVSSQTYKSLDTPEIINIQELNASDNYVLSLDLDDIFVSPTETAYEAYLRDPSLITDLISIATWLSVAREPSQINAWAGRSLETLIPQFDLNNSGSITQRDSLDMVKAHNLKDLNNFGYQKEIHDAATFVPKAEGPFSPLDIDQNGVVDALTDGLLYLRYAFGLTGDALTSSAVAESANRSTQEIEDYLEYITNEAKEGNPALFNIFDFDGSGDIDALTDGLLLMRYAFGLTGGSLVSNALKEESPAVQALEAGEITAEQFYDIVENKLLPFVPEPGRAIADIDGDGKVDASSDGALLADYLSGTRDYLFVDEDGESKKRRSPGATRTENDVRDYLAEITSDPELMAKFDFDGDGELTEDDSVLLLRSLYGLTGDSLTKDITDTDAAEVLSRISDTKASSVVLNDDGSFTIPSNIPTAAGDGSTFTEEDFEGFIIDGDDAPVTAGTVPGLDVEAPIEEEPTEEELEEARLARGEFIEGDDYPSYENYRDNFTKLEFLTTIVSAWYTANPTGIVPPDSDGDLILDSNDDDDDNDGVLDINDVRPFDPDIKTQADLDAYNRQQALDNYDGTTELPEGADKSHIQKRLQFWQDTPLSHFSAEVARKNEFDQIKQDYGTELGKLDLNALGMDIDDDGIPDTADSDRDGDGVDNATDLFPSDGSETTDFDKDGIGDKADTDDDNDNVPDHLDPNTKNAEVWDADQLKDSDNDGTNDYDDTDDDNDGLLDEYEVSQGLDPLKVDSDGDGTNDNVDAFPLDVLEALDSDGDGVGDNADAFPNDASETTDSDNDGTGDNADVFPNDASETADSDNDGTGDNADAFPNDASETADSDGDGTGDNADVFPEDATETIDSDGDGTGDNADVADDNADIQTQVQLDDYNKQQALDNYDGTTELPEGSGEEQIRKRFEYWRDNVPPVEAAAEARKTEAENIKNKYPEAYETVAADFNKDGGDAGVTDLDFFDANPDIAGVTTKAEADEYTAEQARIKALNDYTGEGALPEGSGEKQIRKRLQYWRDNAPVNAEAGEARKTEAAQIAVDYKDAFDTVTSEFDTDEDGVIDLLDVRKDDPNIGTQAQLDAYNAQVERDKDLGVKIVQTDGISDDYSFTNSNANTLEFGYQGYNMPLTPDQLIEGYFAILNGEDWTDPRWEEANKTKGRRIRISTDNENLPPDQKASATYTNKLSGGDAPTGTRQRAEAFLERYTQAEIQYQGKVYQDPEDYETADITYGMLNDDYITLRDIFEQRLPQAGENIDGPVRPDEPFDAVFIPGVDTVPEGKDLAASYYDLRLLKGPEVADNWLDGLIPEFKASLDAYIDNTPGLKTKYNEYEGFASALVTGLPDGVISAAGNMYMLDPDVVDEWVKTVEDSGVKERGEKVVTALRNFHDDEKEVTVEDRYVLGELEQTKQAYYDQFSGSTYTGPDLYDDEGLTEVITAGKSLMLADAYKNPDKYFGDPYSDTGSFTALTGTMAYENAAANAAYGQARLAATHTTGNFYAAGNYIQDESGTINYQWNVDQAQYTNRVKDGLWLGLLMEQELPMWIQTDVFGYDDLTQNLTGEDLTKVKKEQWGDTGLWYDPTRLYMKTPSRTGENHRTNSHGQIDTPEWEDGLIDKNFEWGDETYRGNVDINGNFKEGYFESNRANPNANHLITTNQTPYYGDFSNSGSKHNKGQGFFIDIGGEGTGYGSYSLIWVEQPEYMTAWDNFLNNPALNIFASFVPGGAIILGALKRLNGQTLHGSDYFSMVIDGLKISGKLQLPKGEEAAMEAGDEAVEAATAEFPNITGAELTSIYDEAYSAARLGVAPFDFLTPRQTVGLVKAMTVDTDQLGQELVKVFGNDYFSTGLSKIGIDTSFLSPEVMDSVTNIATDMLGGTSFEDAIKREGASVTLDYFESLDISDQLKGFFDEFMGDIKPAIQAVELMGQNIANSELIQNAIKIVDTVYDSEAIQEIIQTGEVAFGLVGDLTEKLGDVAKSFDQQVLQPLADDIKTGMSKFTTIGNLYDNLPTDITGQIDKYVADISTATGGAYDNLPEALQTAVKESIVSLLAEGEVNELKVARAFSSAVVTVNAVSKLESDELGDLVDAISPQLLTTAIRNSLTAAILPGSPIDAGDALLGTIADGTVNAIKEAWAMGGLEGVIAEFSDFGDKISGKYGDLVDAAEEYNKTPAKLAPLFEQRTTLQEALTADEAELKRLKDIAESAESTDADLEAYRNYAAVFNQGYDSRVAEIAALDGQIDGIVEENESAKKDYEAAVNSLTAETQAFDKKLVTYYDDIYGATLYNLNPEFNLGEYAAANGLQPEGDNEKVTAEQVARHYLTDGIKTGAPVNTDEYNERLAGYTPNLATSALVDSGIDITRLDSTTIQQLENSMLIQADAEAKKEGKTLVQYLEENAENPSSGYTDMINGGIESTFDMSNAEFEASLPQRGAIDFFRNLYSDFDTMSTQDQRDLLTGVATDKLTWVVLDGEVQWGADGFQRQEWNDQLQQFQTYQYDAGGKTKFLVNDDGSIPLIGDREYLGVSSVNNLSTIRANDPLEYFRFTNLAIENDQPAIAWFAEETAKYNRLLDEDASQTELEAVFANIEEESRKYRFEQEGGIDGIPYSELPWSVRTAKRALDFNEAAIKGYELEIARLEAIPEDERDFGYEVDLATAKAGLVGAEAELFITANAIRLAGGISNLVSTGAYAGLKYIETMPARLAANLEFERVYLETGGDYAAAETAKNTAYLSGVEDVDFDVVSNHPNAKNMEILESLAFGYLPEVYQGDVAEFWKVLDAAEGAGDTFKALYGQLKDKPDVFLVEILGMEIGQELFTLAASGGVGGLVTKAAAKDMAADIAKGMGVRAAVGTNIVLETGEIFAGTIDGTYDEAKQALLDIGYTEAAAEAKAYEISVGAGTVAMLLASVVPGARALDKKVLSGGGNEALNELGEKLFTGVDITTKETINEIIQETVSAGYTELALYNAGVEDRDVTGNLALTASIAGLAAAGTTASIYGLGVTNTDPSGRGTGGGGNATNPLTNAILATPQAQVAIESGDPAQLELFLTSTGFTLDTPLTNNIMNIVDDGNYVSTTEARETFDYLGVDPSSEDLFALAGKKADDSDALIIEGEAYWVDTYGAENLGTGRTAAQHYDIIQHLDNMILGIVPLDSSFNMDGDAAITQGDIDYYIQEYLPNSEKLKYNEYVAKIALGEITHENTGIVEEQGGSLMTSAELEQLQSDIKTLKERDPGLSSEEVATIIANDPNINALPGQIDAAVALEFSKEANQLAFANQVAAKLVEDGTIKTESKAAVKEVFGDPEGITTEEKGFFGIIEDIQDKLDLGEGEGTISKFISDQIGTAGTFDDDGKYNNDGTGLLGDLTAQGIDQGLAISEIKNLLGSEGDGTEDNPPTGLYALAAGLADAQTTLDTISGQYDASLANISSNVGTKYVPETTVMEDDGTGKMVERIIPAQPATGLYAAVAEAVNIATTEGADAAAAAATEAILGDYVSLSAFQTAYETTSTEMVNDIKESFGTPPVFQTNDDGTVKRDETGKPLFAVEMQDHDDDDSTEKVEVVTGAPTGFLGEMYNIMQMEGTERDLAMSALETKIDSALTQVESVSSAATATAIKNDVLDVYFPPKPTDYSLGRNIAEQLDYINSLMTTGQYDAAYDKEGEDSTITQADYDAVVASLSDEEKTALDGYNSWLSTPNAITPMMENFTKETGNNFNILNRRIDAVTTAVGNIVIPEVDLSGIEGQITDLDNKIGELPTYNEETKEYEGGSGLRLDLFNQGLTIEEINATFGSVDESDSILGRLAAIKTTADAAATAADLTALDTEVGALTTTIGNAESGLVKTVNDLSEGAITKDNFGQALIDEGVLTTTNIGQALIDAGVATGADVTEAIEGIQFPETDLSGLATTEDVTEAVEGIEFPETDLTGLATTEQAEGIQTSVDQIATLLGKPPNLVTEADVTAVAALVADFEIDSENVAQADMLRYDVNADGIIDTTDQNIIQAGFEGDYTGFAPDAQFNQATGMFLQQQQDQETIADMEQAAIEREAEFLTQMDLQRTQFQQDLDEREEEEKREEFMKAFAAPGRTRTTATPDDPADIKYFYDIAGDDIFANQQQDKFYGAASPFGDNFMNEILTPPRRKAKGGLIDETDEILKILGE